MRKKDVPALLSVQHASSLLVYDKPGGFVTAALKAKNRTTARKAQSKFAVAGREERGMNDEALPSPFTTLLQIDIAAAAEIIAVMSQSPPSLPPGRVPATASTSLIHHNKSIAREAKIDGEGGREGGGGIVN